MTEYTGKDCLFAGLVCVIVLILGAFNLTPGTNTWGDDFAAYINEGIAIDEGRFEEQIRINYQHHPSKLPEEAKDGELVYAWGYPLVLSVIHRVVGFDRVDFTSVIWYKIPSLLGLSLAGGILTLLFRRRFSIYTSAGAALVFCMSGNLFDSLNSLYSDLSFLLFSLLTLWLMEWFVEKIHTGNQTIIVAILYGIAMWMTWETRLSGFTVCAAAFLGHGISIIRDKSEVWKGKIWIHLLPYLVVATLVLVSEHLWLAPATSNLSDLGKPAETNVFQYYCKMIFNYLDGLPKIPFCGLGYLFLVMCMVGIITNGLRQNLHLTLLLIGTLIVDISLPYTNGQRYLYNVLPLMIMYIIYGFQSAEKLIDKIIKKETRIKELFVTVAALGVLFFSTVNQVYRAGDNVMHWYESYSYDAFSDQAKEIYRYIQENVSENAVIAFGKPRVLYLSTGRESFRAGVNERNLKEADYYLKHKGINLDDQVIDVTGMKEIVGNQYLVLYEIQ